MCIWYQRSPIVLLNSHFRPTDGGPQEWAILELQGDLEARGNKSVNNQFIGDLSYNKYGQPVSV